MPSIPDLISEVDRLSRSVSWWNSAIVVMMVVAAIAATGLVVARFIAFKKAQELATTEAKLGKAPKDTQIALD